MMHGVLACHAMWSSLFPMELWKEPLWLLRLEMLPAVLENLYTNRIKSKPTQSWLFSFILYNLHGHAHSFPITRWRQASWCPRPYLKAKTQNVCVQLIVELRGSSIRAHRCIPWRFGLSPALGAGGRSVRPWSGSCTFGRALPILSWSCIYFQKLHENHWKPWETEVCCCKSSVLREFAKPLNVNEPWTNRFNLSGLSWPLLP